MKEIKRDTLASKTDVLLFDIRELLQKLVDNKTTVESKTEIKPVNLDKDCDKKNKKG